MTDRSFASPKNNNNNNNIAKQFLVITFLMNLILQFRFKKDTSSNV